MYFETHAHYDDTAFNDDLDAVLKTAREAGVDYILNPGCDIESSLKAQKIANRYNFVYFAAGIHPSEIKDTPLDYIDTIAEIASDSKCLAIGEIGLDYYWEQDKKAEQKMAFEAQLELALELKKPVIIHDREAHGDTLSILKSYKGLTGVLHCFSGSAEMAEEILKMGFYLGFDGPITYKNNKKADDIIDLCPLDRILIETDSPYLSPVPKRGTRNDSSNLVYIAQKIADVKGISLERASKISYYNAKNCFNLI